MMDFDFEIQYKKGIEMPVDYLSRTPIEALSAINVFKNNYILCMTDAFSKYAEVVAIPNKEAETVAM